MGYRDQTQVVKHSQLLGLTSFLCGSFCSRTQQYSAFNVHTELKSLVENSLREEIRLSGTRQNLETPGVEGLLLGRSDNFRQPALVGSTREHNESQSRQLVSQATYVSGPKETPLLQILSGRQMPQELLKPVSLYQKSHITCHWQKGQMATRDASHHSKVHAALQAPSDHNYLLFLTSSLILNFSSL